VKVVAISDTHGYPFYKYLPEGNFDLFIHSGDFSAQGSEQDFYFFMDCLKQVKAKFKVVVPGNHDIYVEDNEFYCKAMLYTHCETIMLNDELAEIQGRRIYGTPWVPLFGSWSYMRSEAVLSNIYAKIPENLDILVCHGPPKYTLDYLPNGNRVGSYSMERRIKEMEKPPKVYVHGHIHRDESTKGRNEGPLVEGKTTYYNASFCDEYYNPTNRAVVFEI
jgi:Icc-related predicted phosphoesterase